MIKTLIRALREYRQVRQFIVTAERADFWLPEDQMRLLSFMLTGTGQKLRMRLSNMAYKGMMKACSANNHSEYSGEYMRGLARGIGITVQAIDQHLPAKQEKPKDFGESDTVNTDTSGVEQLASR